VSGVERHPLQRTAKTVFDPVAAAVLLVVLSPVLALVALWTFVDAGRPVLFVSPRAGRNGVPFGMLKFRTMVPDAVETGKRLGLTPDPHGLVPQDPRITRSGRFLRRTGLDEIPQLVNVVRGEMSLVGPRPDLVEQARHYTEDNARRLAVRPGITGWSQIHGREDQTWTERFAFDAWYLEHWSLWLDLRIVLRTVGQLFRPEPVPVVDALNVERAGRGAPDAGDR
jgi:lipopolysaccharide/colanic/teichoic acid biosynthesis glycosyltransferase